MLNTTNSSDPTTYGFFINTGGVCALFNTTADCNAAVNNLDAIVSNNSSNLTAYNISSGYCFLNTNQQCADYTATPYPSYLQLDATCYVPPPSSASSESGLGTAASAGVAIAVVVAVIIVAVVGVMIWRSRHNSGQKKNPPQVLNNSGVMPPGVFELGDDNVPWKEQETTESAPAAASYEDGNEDMQDSSA